MNFYKYRNNDRCKCVPMFCWLRGFTSIAYVVPKSWLLNTIFQWKKLMLLGEMVDSKAGAGKVQDEPRTFFFRAESKEAKRMMRHAKKMPESSLKSSHLSIEINHENKALQLSLEQCRFELCGFTYTWIFFFYWPAHFKSKLFNGQLEVGSLHIWKADLLYTEFWLHGW